jgi:hypothetical protein
VQKTTVDTGPHNSRARIPLTFALSFQRKLALPLALFLQLSLLLLARIGLFPPDIEVNNFKVADPVIRVVLRIQMRHGGVEAGPDTVNATRPP